ncbi:MAG TPA: carboxypeptidase regulatory-like domain-containing protein [Gemmatimonadales bacterium]|nr:carboxypeptidase regulatory-like domain-containing protein [Gemmatimonadales bacterium]
MRWIVGSSRAVMAAAVLAMLPGGVLLAQGVTTGAIGGKVTDDKGQPVAEASVQVTNRGTGFTTQTRSRANGQYLVQGLETGGPYTVAIRVIGYRPYTHEGVTVKLSETTRVDAELVAQAVELQAVSISAPATAEFAPTRQGVSTQISDTLVRRIPTLSRDFIDQLKLAPQVTFPASGAASGAGAYNRYNTITIDGANQGERFNLAATSGVPGGSAGGKIIGVDAVKEFRVMFTPTDVRQGNFAGMLVNAVTKSGTNEYHGGATYTYRNSNDIEGVQLVGSAIRVPAFDVKQYGFTAGGPIIRNKLQFFVAPEWQSRNDPASGAFYLAGQPSPAPNDPIIPLDSVQRIINIMNGLGFNAGDVGPVQKGTPLSNLFGRLDWQISPTHRFVIRQIINHDTQDDFSRSVTNVYTSDPLTQNSGYRLGSNGFKRDAHNNSTTAQLYSNFGSGISNELIVGYSTIKDERIVPVQAPEISVGVLLGTTRRVVTLGTEQFSPGNLLDQKIFETVDNVTIPKGAHTFTVGGRLDRTHIFNNFAQGSFGVYKFLNADSLAAGHAAGYAVGYANSQNAADIPADFHVNVYSFYGQDQWAVNDRLTITAGLRADMPTLPDTPPENDTLRVKFDSASAGRLSVNTSTKPGSSMLISPRIGFNYNPGGSTRNQIRGNIGVFTGPPPYIMLGNAYANTGLGLVRLSCTVAGQVPAFTLDVKNLPTSCAGQPAPGPGQAGTLGVNITDPNFKYPQFFGVSAGFDRELPGGFVLTVEGLYRKAINGVLVQDANLKGPRLVDSTNGVVYRDRDGRVMYADTILANGSVVNNGQRWLTSLRGVAFSEGLIEVTNESKDYNYSLSSQIHRRFSDKFEATVAYTYMKSNDVQSLTSDRAISNFRFGRQLSNAHDDLVATTSNFSRPSRLQAYGTYTLPWLTDITVYYEGTSGVPFVYVTNGDLNGDLVNGNDPIYIPRNAKDVSEVQIGTSAGGVFTPNPAMAQAFENFISSQPCLDRQRGRIMERNSCRSPWQNRLDVSVRQAIPAIRGQQLSLQLDIFNFLNLINHDWGQIKLPTLSATNNNQSALIQQGRSPGSLQTSMPIFTLDSRLFDATTLKAKPFESRALLSSNYQVQLTLRYAF